MRALLAIIGVILLIGGLVWGPVGVASRLQDRLPNQFDRLSPSVIFSVPSSPRGQSSERVEGAYRPYEWAFTRARSAEEIRLIKRKIDGELSARAELSGPRPWSAAPRILQTALAPMVLLIAFGMALCFANATASAIVGAAAGALQELFFILPTITGGEIHWVLMSALGGFLAGLVAHATAGRAVKTLRARAPSRPSSTATAPVNVPAPSTGAAKGVGSTLAAGRATPLRVAAPTITGNVQYHGAVVQRRPR
ncbi:MAG: hypothetical protein AB7G15_05225 [Alphaproteobacteria bacterium]